MILLLLVSSGKWKYHQSILYKSFGHHFFCEQPVSYSFRDKRLIRVVRYTVYINLTLRLMMNLLHVYSWYSLQQFTDASWEQPLVPWNKRSNKQKQMSSGWNVTTSPLWGGWTTSPPLRQVNRGKVIVKLIEPRRDNCYEIILQCLLDIRLHFVLGAEKFYMSGLQRTWV